MERAKAMAAHGRRVGHDHAKRLLDAYDQAAGKHRLRVAISSEETAGCHDDWCYGYIAGLHDILRELEGKSKLGLLAEED